MNSEGAPIVSVGVPVYNGERYLRPALDALLSQTFSDLELIIADNASTDSTQDICLEYARRDARVRYVRQDVNHGAPANWNFVARQARGRFFKWASASDLCAPQMISRCVAELADETVVLAYGRTCFINEDGEELGVFDRDFPVEEPRPHERFRRVCHHLSINNAQSGLIRMSVLRQTGLERMYPGGDRVLMAELAMLGKWKLIEEVLLFRRAGGQHFTAMRTSSDLNQMFRPGTDNELSLLNLRRHADFLVSALRSPVATRERMGAALAAVKGLYWDRRGLREDLARLTGRAPA